jgi:hypothetical protein
MHRSIAVLAVVFVCAGASPYGQAFWAHWSDGQAELAAYDLVVSRYGQLRKGSAVAIFVTETFSNSARVKADPGRHPSSDTFPVLKLNFIQDFPTGVYDYNLMTSTFVALQRVNGRPAGYPTKVSFSSQEWCGHVYHQLRLDAKAIRHESHSYFDREADQRQSIAYPAGGVTGDALLLWARGLASPALAPGGRAVVPFLRSLQDVRLGHVPLAWGKAVLARADQPQRVTVPAGAFDAQVRTVAIQGGRTWTFFAEQAAPHRLLKWQASDGHQGELIASKRMKYWQMNRNGFEKALKDLGLKPRPARTP